jgi:hypothetical protein
VDTPDEVAAIVAVLEAFNPIALRRASTEVVGPSRRINEVEAMTQNTETVVSPPTVEQSATTAAARRMQNYRKRRRSGLRCFTVKLFEKEIDSLVRKGLLKTDARHDPYAVRDALHTLLARTLGQTP